MNVPQPIIIGLRVVVGIAAIVVLVLVLSHHGKPPPRHGYTLTPPPGWSRVTPPPDGASVAFADPTADVDAGHKIRAVVSVQSSPLDSSELKMSFNQLAQLYLSGLATNYQDYKQTQAVEIKLAGQPAVLVTYSFEQSNTALTTESLFLTKYGNSYAVTGQALTSAWPAHASAIQHSLLTFRP